MASVTLRNVSKVFDKQVEAVKNVDLDVRDKEFLVLVGPSGCGKSTLLRMIAGLEEVSSGDIFIGPNLVNQIPPKDRNIAMVFQNYALYPHMTVSENMAFGLKLRKYPKDQIANQVRQAAAILNIEELLDRKPKALSGGQRQRVAVGRAIVRNPEVFLFDEPLSNLDAKLRVQMRTELSKLHKKLTTTMIYVTHDQVEAMTMGNRIVVLKDGVVQQIDTPLSIYNHPRNKFVAGFIGSPSMNFLTGKICKDDNLWFDHRYMKVKVSAKHEKKLTTYVDKEVIFGIRPENLREANSATNPTDFSAIQLTVEVIEPMGNETYLYLAAGPNPVIARLGSTAEAKVGEMKRIAVETDKAHFFDTETEERIV